MSDIPSSPRVANRANRNRRCERQGTYHVLAVIEHHLDRPDTPFVVVIHGAMDRSRSFRRVVGYLTDLRS
jgi:hypothetical protein